MIWEFTNVHWHIWGLGNCTVGFVDLLMRTVDILEFKCEEVVGFIRDL